VGLDYTDVRVAFQRWGAKAYDLAWLYQVESYVSLGPLLQMPIVVDVNDLEDHKIAARLAMERSASQRERWTVSQRLRRSGSRLLDQLDPSRWRALYTELAQAVDAVVVCSELDRQRLGVPNAQVIVNGYEEQATPLGRLAVGNPPTVAFIGLFTYGPNLDAAAFLVDEILPSLRLRIPSVRVRLVGRASEQLRAFHHPPEVVVTGFVEEIGAELAQADLIVVPVRYGGGTRIKILEAFAHRIPVVSTTMGAEGIDAMHGREIMLEDSPAGFAEACAALLTNVDLRRSITDAAQRLFLARYRWDRMQDAVEALASQVAGSRAPHAGE
jgi:glycosyltransferase involved in cell wall biosynthesis